MAARDLNALEFIDAEVKSAVEVLERRGDSLDTKAGLCLGFAGVLASLLLRAGMADGPWAYVALGVNFVVATLSLLAYRVRTNPVLDPRTLCAYIGTEERLARRAVLDSRLVACDEANSELEHKARLVSAALTGLLLAVTVTAVATGQTLGGGHGPG